MSRPSYRPVFHFTARENWLNDPNGLVWYDGEYHLFFQHNPHGSDWGDMSWGHAVSRDLLRWEELPVALTAGATEHVYSGSVVVDHHDTSGLGRGGEPAFVALYTSVDLPTGRQTQALAVSHDRGRTWTRHAGNPVLDVGSTDFRDPKVFWHAATGRWVMVVVLSVERVVRVYGSPDLLAWEHLSDFGPAGAVDGVWECPDLFELPVDGDPGRTRWVLVVSLMPGGPVGGSGMQYFVGDFDGTTYTVDEDHGPRWVDHGSDYYAAVSFNDAPHDERVMVGWMSNWDYAAQTPTAPFRGAMAVPRICRLREVAGRVVLVQEPVPGLGSLPGSTVAVEGRRLGPGRTPLAGLPSGAAVVDVVFRPVTAERFGLGVLAGAGRTSVGYDATTRKVYVDRRRSGAGPPTPSFAAEHRAPLPGEHDVVRLRVLLDRCSVEVFAGDGETVLTDLVFADAATEEVVLFAEGGDVEVVSLTLQVLEGRPGPAG